MKRTFLSSIVVLFAVTCFGQQQTVEELSADQMLIARGFKIYQADQRLICCMEIIGNKSIKLVKFPGELLTPDEVRQSMTNKTAAAMYNKGINRNRIGNILLISGSGVFVAGLIVDTSANSLWQEDIGAALAWSGISMIVVGTTLKLTGRKNVKHSVDLHNRGNNRMGIEWEFGFTSNGVGVALRF